MGDVNDKPRRRYSSATRSEGARRTRQAIVATAGALFVERGYAATSLADIATAAGVARPTVFAAFGSKGALLGQVLDQGLAGDDAPVPVAERPWFQPVWSATTPAAVFAAYAEVCLVIGRRAAPLFEAVRRAADDAPEAAQLWATLQDNRRAGARMVVAHAQRLGPLAPHLDADTATDIVWIYNDPAHYAALVSERGWAEDRFRQWLADTMCQTLLGGPS
ncbi:TetR/AcrR family transcriptional regulator [Dactylosporangium sp. CA-139066]|uniref:TetR/AcrR family transcriptional regulator n=1 Tax=Dactylosporangium sp. CA-139066 TaxID=3239930 RepID=UPI003D8CB3C7